MDCTSTLLKRVRKLRGFTQEEVARRAGIHTVLYRQYELGMKRPKDSQLQKIADALVVFAGYLRLPKIDSADNLSSLLFALRNHYGSVKIKKNHSAFSIELPYSSLDAVTIARLNEMVDQSENLPPEEFDEWLLNYRLNHLLKLDFNSETATPLHSDLLDRNNSSQPSDNS